jgi:hypothetical protein
MKKLNKNFPMFFSPSIHQFFQKSKDCLMTCDIVAWLETNTTQHIKRNKNKNSFLPIATKVNEYRAMSSKFEHVHSDGKDLCSPSIEL